MILYGNLVIAGPDDCCRLEAGTVQVRDGIITEVNLGDAPAHFDAGGPRSIISPGFIDAHLHLPQFNLIGAHGMPLLKWLSDVTFPSEMKWADTEYARGMTTKVMQQLLSVGTTAVAAYATVHHEATVAALEVASDMGMRGVIGQVLMDREAPSALCGDAQQLLDEAAQLMQLFPAGRRLSAAVTPRFAISCSDDLLRGAGRLANESGATIQTHLAETLPECEYVAKLFDGTAYVNVYEQAGLLSRRTLLGHGIYLDADAQQVLCQTGAAIVHCPTANSFLRSGTMPRHGHKSSGVKLAIGSDIGAGYERSMVRVARAMIESAASIGDQFPSVGEAWYAITAGNADNMGWNGEGRLAVGASADLVVIEPDIDWLDAASDPLAIVMFAWDDRWIRETLLSRESA